MVIARLKPARAYALYQSLWTALDWLYPPNCLGCGKPGSRLCMSCISDFPQIGGKVCSICGLPSPSQATCSECNLEAPPIDHLRSFAIYRDIARTCILQMKFHRDIGLGISMAVPMIHYFQSLSWKVDIVTTIPLSPRRIKSRGYNQSALLARPLAYFYGLPYTNSVVKRIINTPSQVGLSRIERHKNVTGAFRANPRFADKKNILLVDDVATTGSTINACAKALKEAGAAAVFGLTFARAINLQDDAEGI